MVGVMALIPGSLSPSLRSGVGVVPALGSEPPSTTTRENVYPPALSAKL